MTDEVRFATFFDQEGRQHTAVVTHTDSAGQQHARDIETGADYHEERCLVTLHDGNTVSHLYGSLVVDDNTTRRGL